MGAAYDAAVVAGKHHVRVIGMGRQRPNVPAGRVLSFPVLSPVIAPVDAVLGPGENYTRVLGTY